MRTRYGIRHSVSAASLASRVGKNIVELRGTVKGTFDVGDRVTVLLEDGSDDSVVVDAAAVPDWLRRGEVRARLIVQTDHPREFDATTYRLVGVAPEEEIAALERKEQAARPQPRAILPSRAATPRAVKGRTWSVPASEVLPHYTNFVRRANPRLSAREAETIARSVIGFSLKYGVDARLIMAIVMVESDFNPNCVSSAGAMGLGQLMPCNVQELGIRRPHDLVENIWGTVKLVRGHLDRYKAGSSDQGLILALAAYNAGDGAVKRAGGVPPYRETQRYVVKVTTLYRRLCGL